MKFGYRGDKVVAVQQTTMEYEIYYIVENKEYGIKIYLNKLVLTIISLIIFLIFYKYDIQLISTEYIKYIKIYLKLCFISYIIIIIIKIIIGLYYVKILNESTDHLGQSILLITRLITFLINMSFFYWMLDLNIDLFLQYNIMFILDLTMIVIFKYYIYIYDYRISYQFKPSFLNYPWIMLILTVILIKLEKKIDKMFWLVGNDVVSIYKQ